MKFLFLICIFPCVFSITIRDASVMGDGADKNNPVEEGKELRLQCVTDSTWAQCGWQHEIEGETDSNGNQMKVSCSGTQDHNGDICSNNGGSPDLDNAYANRIRIETGPNICALRISKADPRDNGEWSCNMREDIMEMGSVAKVEVYAANQSRTFITLPDLWRDPDDIIEYVIGDSSSEIEAACTAYGGNPEPEFHWYVGNDDSDSEISFKRNPNRQSGRDDLGDYITEKITWEPTMEDFCNFDDTQNDCENYQFTFDLICKVEQRGGNGKEYYQQENDMQTDARVSVDVRNGASSVLFSWSIFLFVSVYVSQF